MMRGIEDAAVCPFCDHAETLKIELGVTICQVFCECGCAAPSVAPGDYGCNTDEQRQDKAITLWNALSHAVQRGP